MFFRKEKTNMEMEIEEQTKIIPYILFKIQVIEYIYH